MKIAKTVLHTVSVTLLLSVLGCAVPREARDTSRVLSIYTVQLNAEMQRFANSRTEIDKMRLANANYLEQSAYDTQTRNMLLPHVWQLAGAGGRAKFLEEILATADLAARQEEALTALVAEQDAAVRSAKSAVVVQSKKLDETAKGLSALAEKPSLRQDLEFLAKFVSDVQAELKKSSTNVTSEAAAGKDLAKKKKDNLPQNEK